MCVSVPVILSFCILAHVVVSEMPNESLAHRPVEMLPLICSRDQREAAQLQVREHAARRGVMTLRYCEIHILLHTFIFLPSERRWPRRTTLPWIKLAWKLCPIRYTDLYYLFAPVCMSFSWLVSPNSFSLLSQIWVDYINFLKGV